MYVSNKPNLKSDSVLLFLILSYFPLHHLHICIWTKKKLVFNLYCDIKTIIFFFHSDSWHVIIVEKTQHTSLFCDWYSSLHFQVSIAWEWVMKQWATFPCFKLSDLSRYTKLPERKNSGQGFWQCFICHIYDCVPWPDSHHNRLMYCDIFYSIHWWQNVIWGQNNIIWWFILPYDYVIITVWFKTVKPDWFLDWLMMKPYLLFNLSLSL